MLPDAKYRPVTPCRDNYCGINMSLLTKMRYIIKRILQKNRLMKRPKVVQKALDRIYNPPKGKIIEWKWLIVGYLGLLAITVSWIIFYSSRTMSDKGYFRKQWYAGFLCASPWLIGFTVFTGGPILFSIVMSFLPL